MLTVNASRPIPGFTKSSVLCVIDFSEASKEALKSAIFMADQFGTALTVLYPYRLNQLDHHGATVMETKLNMDLAASENFKKIAGPLLDGSKVSWDFRPEVGFFNDRIYAYAKKNKVGLLIISKRLVTNNKEGFMEMMDQLQTPVLVVPQNEFTKA